MKKLKKYDSFLILEKFDDNIIAELRRLGVEDEEEIKKHLYHAHRGNLAKYLEENGRNFTFVECDFSRRETLKEEQILKLELLKPYTE